ncbi:MAG: FHA domain-containing protein [Lachnospiraceae bacterium]|nr:FHA domain-containing protein [Lachnospiraceae bacterium]
MALQECGNGHLYDASMYPSCPYCSGGINRVEFGGGGSGVGATVAGSGYGGAQGGYGGGYGVGATVAGSGYGGAQGGYGVGATVAGSGYGGGQGNYGGMPVDSGIGKTVGVGMAAASAPSGPADVGSTIAPAAYRAKQQADDADTGKTVGVMQKHLSVDPVVGWLVCISGAEKGKDHRIYARNNTIGRSEKMDICIKGDSAISRENHARLSYDSKHNAYHLIPAESANNIYLNEEPVYVPTKLAAHDVIEFGESRFMFIPLCDDCFTWQDGLKSGETKKVEEDGE